MKKKIMPYLKLAGSVLVILIVFKLVMKAVGPKLPAAVTDNLPSV